MAKVLNTKLTTMLKDENKDLWEMHQEDQMTLRERDHTIAALEATIKDLKKLAECPSCGRVREAMEEERMSLILHHVQTGCNGSPHKCKETGQAVTTR